MITFDIPSKIDPNGRWSTYCGDSRHLLRFTHDGVPVDAVFADPPYNIGYDYKDHYSDKMKPMDYEVFTRSWVTGCIDILKPGGALWIFVSDEAIPFIMKAIEGEAVEQRNWIAVYETFGVQTSTKFSRCKRHLLYYAKKGSKPTFNRKAVIVPSDRQTKYNDKRANPKGKVMPDVWADIPRVAGTHKERDPRFANQVPVKLIRRCVEVSTNPDELVVDPFMGSGSCGKACAWTGRRFRGIELAPQLYEWGTEAVAQAFESSLAASV